MYDQNVAPDFGPMKVEIPAPENWLLCGHLFSNLRAEAAAPVVLISAAAAVPQTYYFNFARACVAAGAAAVLTYDYRGMCLSAGPEECWPDLGMADWALLDFPAATDWLASKYPGRQMVGIGHSYGGQALGLSGVADQFSRYSTIATMSGYWGDLDEPWSVYLKSVLVGQAFARVMGYIPKWGGLGEAMPGPIFLDWVRWIKMKNYFFDDAKLPQTAKYKEVQIPILSNRVADDSWGTLKAVESFMNRYENAELRHRIVEPDASGPIGHLGFFRQRHAESHWPSVIQFLLDGQWPANQ